MTHISLQREEEESRDGITNQTLFELHNNTLLRNQNCYTRSYLTNLVSMQWPMLAYLSTEEGCHCIDTTFVTSPACRFQVSAETTQTRIIRRMCYVLPLPIAKLFKCVMFRYLFLSATVSNEAEAEEIDHLSLK